MHGYKVRRAGSMIMVGTVKWFSREQGQGFIAVDGGQDVFVHFRAVQDSGLSELNLASESSSTWRKTTRATPDGLCTCDSLILGSCDRSIPGFLTTPAIR